MANVGDKVRVARGEGKYWLGAEGVVASREEREYSRSIVQVTVSKMAEGNNDRYHIGEEIGFYEDSVDVIEPAPVLDTSVVPLDEEAVRLAAEYLGVDVTPVYRVLELARRMTAFADETEGD